MRLMYYLNSYGYPKVGVSACVMISQRILYLHAVDHVDNFGFFHLDIFLWIFWNANLARSLPLLDPR